MATKKSNIDDKISVTDQNKQTIEKKAKQETGLSYPLRVEVHDTQDKINYGNK